MNINENEVGIGYNTFYATNEELGIKQKSEEELMEYKRLIGMPLYDDYDELIANLKPLNQIKQSENPMITNGPTLVKQKVG